MEPSSSTTEIIAVASGKGGTGKTLFTSCLGYALGASAQRVLMIDADPATNGLSLFLLGPKGWKTCDNLKKENTFADILRNFEKTGVIAISPYNVNRSLSDDHGVEYKAILSDSGLYGDSPPDHLRLSAVPDLDRPTFQRAITALFNEIRASGLFDYVLVDTRGGFSFESTDVCALADSFIVITHPEYTSLYQDRNLRARISDAALELNNRPLLRAIIVNKIETGLAEPYRIELAKEFGVDFDNTFPVRLDIDAIRAYTLQQIPYVQFPASSFSSESLTAFDGILRIVTRQWGTEQIRGWRSLFERVKSAIVVENISVRAAREMELNNARERENLKKENAFLHSELDNSKARITEQIEITRNESARSNLLIEQIRETSSQQIRQHRLMSLAMLLIVGLLIVAGFILNSLSRATDVRRLAELEARLKGFSIKEVTPYPQHTPPRTPPLPTLHPSTPTPSPIPKTPPSNTPPLTPSPITPTPTPPRSTPTLATPNPSQSDVLGLLKKHAFGDHVSAVTTELNTKGNRPNVSVSYPQTRWPDNILLHQVGGAPLKMVISALDFNVGNEGPESEPPNSILYSPNVDSRDVNLLALTLVDLGMKLRVVRKDDTLNGNEIKLSFERSAEDKTPLLGVDFLDPKGLRVLSEPIRK